MLLRRRVSEFRVSVFGQPRGPWRQTLRQAQRDAIAIGLGSFDETGQFYSTVPGDIEWRDITLTIPVDELPRFASTSWRRARSLDRSHQNDRYRR